MARPARSATTVSVGCKLPQGLHVHVDGFPPLRLNGSASAYVLAHTGFGVTHGVPVEQWDALCKQHARAKWLANGFVFAHSEPESVAAEAQERKDTKAGFEPIDPKQPAAGLQPLDAADPLA